MKAQCRIIGAPVGSGAGQSGCQMGPEAYRIAGLESTLRNLGIRVEESGNLKAADIEPASDVPGVRNLAECVAWTKALSASAETALAEGAFPIFAGGDHSLSLGSVSGASRHAADTGRPLYLLWLDAHPDFHRLDTSTSGNLHGTPVAYVSGQPSFTPHFPKVTAPVDLSNVCMIGIRSVDADERKNLVRMGVAVHDMRTIDEVGVAKPVEAFLKRVADANGMLHVSLDVDFLDPTIAPAVGTTVPGGATFREAHLIMELLHESGLVTSLDLVELNPYLDHAGMTARLMVDLTASLMGRTVMDRPTRSF